MRLIKIIKKLLFNDFSTDIAFRYLPVVDIIKKNNLHNSKILEVGSGDLGLTQYLKKKITGVDIYFEDEKNTDLLKKIKIIGAGLPFSDDEFDVAVSVDSLEHVKKENRPDFIKEIIRVTKKYIIVVVPCGQSSWEQDKIIDKKFYNIFKYHNKFLNDHLANGLPDEQELSKLFTQVFAGKSLSIMYRLKLTNLHIRHFYMGCNFSKNLIYKYIYYLFLLLLPIKKILDFGKCYRQIIFIKIN